MTRLWTLLRRLFLLRAQEDRDLDDELAFHVAEETRMRIERGAAREDAERAARLAFGSVTLAKETTRGVWVSGAMAATVSTNYFRTLEVPLAIGRSFAENENQTATPGLVMVISDLAWREYFASAPSIVGAAATINSSQRQIR
jgi:MacB-like periplasmic core domain